MNPAKRRPNILMVISDQERADALGCYGNPICRTPVLDRLAAEGVRFDACFAPSPICSPCRASMLTGLYPHGHGVLNNTHEPDAIRREIPPEIPTYSELLRDNGYRLGYVGKWHLGPGGPESRGFHDVVGLHENVVASVGEDAIVETEPDLLEPIYARYPRGKLLIAGIDARPEEATDTRRDTDATIGLLERYASIEEPFFLRVDYEGPHHPYMPPQRFAAMYDPAAMPPWPNFDEDLRGKPAAQARLLEQRGVAGWSWSDWQPVVARYYGFISYIDSEIGRILDAVDQLGLREDTVVIHTADHGDMTGSHGGQFNKGPLMYDEVCRIPLIVRDPGRAVVGVCEASIGSLALMPTILALAGVSPPAGLHVDSLVPYLDAPDRQPVDDAAFAEYHGEEWGLYSQRMIRTPKGKYVYSPHGTDEVYDLVADPHEQINRVDDAEYSQIRTELRGRLLDWMVRTNDPLALWASRLL